MDIDQDDVNELDALCRLARHFYDMQAQIVEDIMDITGEDTIDGERGNTAAWDVVHNGESVQELLRRCNLVLRSDTTAEPSHG